MAVIDIEYGKAILAEQGDEIASQNPSSLEWEMVMQNSSYGHEYARIELAEVSDMLEQEVLLSKMENFKRAYFMARRFLKKENPLRLEEVETQLLDQKVRIFGTFNA